jgi:hypothetical protein
MPVPAAAGSALVPSGRFGSNARGTLSFEIRDLPFNDGRLVCSRSSTGPSGPPRIRAIVGESHQTYSSPT